MHILDFGLWKVWQAHAMMGSVPWRYHMYVVPFWVELSLLTVLAPQLTVFSTCTCSIISVTVATSVQLMHGLYADLIPIFSRVSSCAVWTEGCQVTESIEMYTVRNSVKVMETKVFVLSYLCRTRRTSYTKPTVSHFNLWGGIFRLYLRQSMHASWLLMYPTISEYCTSIKLAGARWVKVGIRLSVYCKSLSNYFHYIFCARNLFAVLNLLKARCFSSAKKCIFDYSYYQDCLEI